jgi:hypothetical protein
MSLSLQEKIKDLEDKLEKLKAKLNDPPANFKPYYRIRYNEDESIYLMEEKILTEISEDERVYPTDPWEDLADAEGRHFDSEQYHPSKEELLGQEYQYTFNNMHENLQRMSALKELAIKENISLILEEDPSVALA